MIGRGSVNGYPFIVIPKGTKDINDVNVDYGDRAALTTYGGLAITPEGTVGRLQQGNRTHVNRFHRRPHRNLNLPPDTQISLGASLIRTEKRGNILIKSGEIAGKNGYPYVLKGAADNLTRAVREKNEVDKQNAISDIVRVVSAQFF